ncbi:four helix bundle protein [Polaribacter gangjinensis]|uniref:Four helix bundle protein n=1 Tax=Polaribacter gangjinensis TaxID=574710 RepID=A0A2S7WDI9_9FLAO|nr:four helix bundle protein [Polaribacter gangjinensis]PQJ75476.1 four helix bundle protein [Polaribacter gangjinensis]
MEDVTFKFEELTVYKKAIEFINDAYNVSKTFPKSEIYGLTSQFLRASNSIALNITEGSGDTNLQFSRFLKIALGSVKECVVCLTIAKNQQYITLEKNSELRIKLVELSKMITGLKKYLNQKTNS